MANHVPCVDVSPLLPDYLRRRLPAERHTAVREHLAACVACATAFDAERDFSALIGGTDAAPPPALFTHVMAQVRDEPRLPAFRVRPHDVLLALGGTAAALGMLFGVMSLLVVLPPVTTLTANGLSLPDGGEWLTSVAPLLTWLVSGLIVVAVVSFAVHASFAGSERASE